MILQLRSQGFSGRAIATSQSISRRIIAAVIDGADNAGVSWDEVYDLLFPGRRQRHRGFTQPDWDLVHRELARVEVTLRLLHGEYADRCARDGSPAIGYGRFCRTYQRHVLITGAASRVGYKAAHTVEFNGAGPTMTIHDVAGG